MPAGPSELLIQSDETVLLLPLSLLIITAGKQQQVILVFTS
jgi:hypothetical protein